MTGSAPSGPGPPDDAPRILVAEDEPLAAMAIEDLLAGAGYAVLLAADGQEALEIAARGARFDLLLTDLRMPRLAGRELIRRLRAARPDLPVVVMTGYAPPDGAASLLRDAGGTGPLLLFTKPIEPEQLLDAVGRLAGWSRR
ncbi:response regulator [Caldovatus aquaticus]|uniref:Response regulator n=1 Tax=Caldovatus aquaticus TaxID=2865671 RepID=A0ABS7F547_9PROT|nr:response regulator [Caldovatus aquaticus]MBW8270744.1 response regulator [Caldovatus aquaticus]